MKKYLSIFLLLPVFCAWHSHGQVISTFAGSGATSYSGDGGPATAAGMTVPGGVAMDRHGNIYFADNNDSRVRMIDTNGIITTVAGNGTTSFLTAGPATATGLYSPIDVATDTAGNLYIADRLDAYVIKVDAAGMAHIFAGKADSFGYNGDGIAATAAKLWFPSAVVADKHGNVYITDQSNYRIRKVNAAGIISTVVGTGSPGYSGDGGAATAAKIQNPEGLSLDRYGNLYLSDNLTVIRKVDTNGIITTVAGIDSLGYSGDGGPATAAKMNRPITAIADTAGNLYITDGVNNCIRMVNTAGVISTLAGTTTAGFSGDGGPASAAKMNYPWGIMMDNAGVIYFADGNNRRLRKITPGTGTLGNISPHAVAGNTLQVWPQPSNGTFSIRLSSASSGNVHIVISSLVGEKMAEFTAATNEDIPVHLHAAAGIYFIKAMDEASRETVNAKVIVR